MIIYYDFYYTFNCELLFRPFFKLIWMKINLNILTFFSRKVFEKMQKRQEKNLKAGKIHIQKKLQKCKIGMQKTFINR